MIRNLAIVCGLLITPLAWAADQPDPSAPFRLGIIGLDTSHAPAFTRLINDPDAPPERRGCRVVAAYPQGSKTIESSIRRVAGYTEELEKMGVEIVPSIAALLERVDGVLLESNDGHPHLEQIRPVLEAGKPVYVDKPLAGSLADAVTLIREAQAAGVPIFSSSSLRYTPGAQKARQGGLGRVIGCDAYSPCSLEPTHPDFFWYGIHGVELLFTVMGTGCEEVVRMHTEGTDLAVGRWSDGRIATFRGIREGKSSYGGTVFGQEGIEPLGPSGGYEPLVQEIVKFFRTGQSPVNLEETLEIYAFMEAADESKRQGGRPVTLREVLHKATSDPDGAP
jgi:predicted dehydrogenase